MGHTSLMLQQIEQYLPDLGDNLKTDCSAKAKNFALKAAIELGYLPPFNPEQFRLCELLIAAGAGQTAARTAWSYYHDFYAIQAMRANAA